MKSIVTDEMRHFVPHCFASTVWRSIFKIDTCDNIPINAELSKF